MIKLVNTTGAIDLSQKMMKGDDGGYYIPSLDETTGELTWIPSDEGMAAVEGGNIKGPKGDPGAQGLDGKNTVWYGDEEPTEEYDIWLAPGGEGSAQLVTNDVMVKYVTEEINKIELMPGPQGEPGEPGKDGEPGAPGADGHTPVKGTDYWTAADKEEIVEDVLAALPTAEGVEV